jgi:hypothetical protein
MRLDILRTPVVGKVKRSIAASELSAAPAAQFLSMAMVAPALRRLWHAVETTRPKRDFQHAKLAEDVLCVTNHLPATTCNMNDNS